MPGDRAPGSMCGMTTNSGEPETPPGTDYPPHRPNGTDGFFDSVRRTGLVRSDDRWVGGVSSGLALRMGIDPLIVRGIFGVSVLLGGLGLVLYGAGWLLMPEQRDGRIHIQQLFRGDFDAAVIGGFAALLIGFTFPTRWLPLMWWGGDAGWLSGLVGLVAVAVIIAVAISVGPKRQGGGAPPPQVQPTAPAAPRRTEGPVMYPAPATALPTPAVPPAIQRPRTRGAGGASVGVVLALGLLILAGLLYADRVNEFDGPVLLAAGAAVVVLAGLGIVVAGLRGRTSGGLGAIAVISVLVMLPFAAFSNVRWDRVTTFVAADSTNVPNTVTAAERGYNIGVGSTTVDLTEVPLGGPAVEVPIHLGAGELLLILPEDGAYTARVQVLAGELLWLDDVVIDGVRSHGWETFESPAVTHGAEPDLELTVTVGAGSVRVIEED